MIVECRLEGNQIVLKEGVIMPNDAVIVDADSVCIAPAVMLAWVQCARNILGNGDVSLHDLDTMEEEFFFSDSTPQLLYLCFASTDGSRILAQMTIVEGLWVWEKTGA